MEHIETEYQKIYKVENLISWLETKDPLENYNYNSCKNCLLAQYLKEHIPEFVSIGVTWRDNKNNRYEIPNFRELNFIAFGIGYNKGKWTFGAALERAKTYAYDA